MSKILFSELPEGVHLENDSDTKAEEDPACRAHGMKECHKPAHKLISREPPGVCAVPSLGTSQPTQTL